MAMIQPEYSNTRRRKSILERANDIGGMAMTRHTAKMIDDLLQEIDLIRREHGGDLFSEHGRAMILLKNYKAQFNGRFQ